MDQDGNIRYFWVDYFGEMDDFQKRERILEMADELSSEIAMDLRRADELSEFNHSEKKAKEARAEQVMRSSGFSKKYKKAIKKDSETRISEIEFAIISMEETAKHLRQRRLNDSKRNRVLTLEDMVVELDSIAENRFEYKATLGESLYWRLYEQTIDLDDVVLTEEDARCVAISWRLSKRISKQDITTDSITANQVREFFPELFDNTDVNNRASEIIAKIYNLNRDNLLRQREEKHRKKVESLDAMKQEYKGIEL